MNRAGKRRIGAGAGETLLMSAALLALAGCGQQYRPVVAAINPVGPAPEPAKYAIAISSPTSGTGLLTAIDFAGDSVIATPQILPSPTYVSVYAVGTSAVAINAQNSLSYIPLTSLDTLLTSNVVQTALPSNPSSDAPTVTGFDFNAIERIFLPEPGRSAVAIFGSGSPALQVEDTVPANPVYVVGVDNTPRAYVLSTNNGSGTAAAVEATSLGISATLPVGVNPVYGVETADDRRVFVVNKGSGTVSVINVTSNAIDNANPTIPATGTLGQNPVWADLAAATNTLVVLNAGDQQTTPGSLSIINIPLCNAAAQPSNGACNPADPNDGQGFGTVYATVPVGVNPSEVSVLPDGSQAFVVNRGNPAAGIPGSLTVVNLVAGKVTATIPAALPPTIAATATCPDGSTLSCIYGTPTTVASINGSPTGKVYITAPDSNYMTVLETDTDSVATHVDLQGAGVQVRVTSQ